MNRTVRVSFASYYKGARNYQVGHSRATSLIDSFHEFKDVMCVTINSRNAEIVVVFILCSAVKPIRMVIYAGRTEYEFSPTWDEPVAKIFGEYSLEYMLVA